MKIKIKTNFSNIGLQVLVAVQLQHILQRWDLSLNSSSAADTRDSSKSVLSLQDGGDNDGADSPLLLGRLGGLPKF